MDKEVSVIEKLSQKELADYINQLINTAVTSFVHLLYKVDVPENRVKQILADNKEAMERLTQALLERETLDSVQIRRIVAGLSLDDDSGTASSDDTGTPQKSGEEGSLKPFKTPILPPINPATA